GSSSSTRSRSLAGPGECRPREPIAARAAPWAGPSALPHSSRSQSSTRSDWARRRDGPTAGSANPSWSTWVIRRAASGSEDIRPPLTGADPCHRADVAAPHLPVTAPAVAGGAGAAVDLGVPSLAAESGGLGDGEARDAVLAQGVGDRLQGVGLDDGGDQLHRLSPVAAGWWPAFAAGAPAPAPVGRGLRGSRSMGWGRGTDAAREDRSRRAARAP